MPIYSLGYSQKRYTAQNFVCSDSAPSLVNCSNYDTSDSVSSMCYVGPHVAGVRCTESKFLHYFFKIKVVFKVSVHSYSKLRISQLCIA